MINRSSGISASKIDEIVRNRMDDYATDKEVQELFNLVQSIMTLNFYTKPEIDAKVEDLEEQISSGGGTVPTETVSEPLSTYTEVVLTKGDEYFPTVEDESSPYFGWFIVKSEKTIHPRDELYEVQGQSPTELSSYDTVYVIFEDNTIRAADPGHVVKLKYHRVSDKEIYLNPENTLPQNQHYYCTIEIRTL